MYINNNSIKIKCTRNYENVCKLNGMDELRWVTYGIFYCRMSAK